MYILWLFVCATYGTPTILSEPCRYTFCMERVITRKRQRRFIIGTKTYATI